MTQDRKNFIHRNEAFDCSHCHQAVPPLKKGCRNHCPFCLYSLHVDQVVPGDRTSACGGLMRPTQLESGSRKGYLGFDLVHECTRCGKRIKNILAEDDDWGKLNPVQ